MNMTLLAFAMPGVPELLIIAGIFVLLFGASALPKLARNAGKVLPSFKAGMKEVEKEAELIKNEIDDLKRSGESVKRDLESALKN